MRQQPVANAVVVEADVAALVTVLMQGVRQYGIAFLDPSGTITGWSGGCHAITGFRAEDVLGRSFAMLFTPDDVDRELHLHELNSAGLLGTAEDDRWHMRRDGSRFWASGITLRLDTDGRTRGFAKLFRDTTHIRLRMDRVENEVRALQQAGHQRDVFLATIAHELRNPLQPMRFATRMLGMSQDPAHQAESSKVLERQLDLVERVVEDLVDLARVHQGRMRVDYQRVLLQELLCSAADSCRSAAQDKGVALVCVMPPVPIEVEVDPDRLTQVVTNLVNNAIKFTPASGSVAVLATVDRHEFVVTVKDTGRGIPPELQPQIFEMFTQAESVDTRRGQGGLGIGLALVKEIVSLHRGTVEVRSEGAGRGSEFFVRIPILQPATPPNSPV